MFELNWDYRALAAIFQKMSVGPGSFTNHSCSGLDVSSLSTHSFLKLGSCKLCYLNPAKLSATSLQKPVPQYPLPPAIYVCYTIGLLGHWATVHRNPIHDSWLDQSWIFIMETKWMMISASIFLEHVKKHCHKWSEHLARLLFTWLLLLNVLRAAVISTLSLFVVIYS